MTAISSTNHVHEHAVFRVRDHEVKYLPALLLIAASWVLFGLCTWASLSLRAWNHDVAVVALILGHAFLLLFHHGAFYRLLSQSTARTLITTHRVLGTEQQLWLSERVTDVPLWKIRSLEVVKRGVLRQLLDFGTIRLNDGELPSLQNVARPHIVHSRIAHQVQQLQTNLERPTLVTSG
jgi:hypothetical protein